MSYIRALEDGRWEDVGPGLYVYSDGSHICYLPNEHHEFIEVVMRMLEQSPEELDDETLEVVHTALRRRMRL